MTIVKTLLGVLSEIGLWKMDVKNAFLHGNLCEAVYIKPPGYTSPPNLVYCSKKSLYGLKQAPRAWFSKCHTTTPLGRFCQSHNDHCLFIQHTNCGFTIL